MTVFCEEKNGLGVMTLHRPDALNALTYEMLLLIDEALTKWEKNPGIQMVVIVSSSEKAFCSGADIKFFYENGIEDWERSYQFLKLEYTINRKIFYYPKPYVAIMNGIVMGGGVGISLYGSDPIATDTIRFALPEVAIGFFPDVGSTYFLPRLPYRVGWYLALTGNSITPFDALAVGLVKHVIRQGEKEKLLSFLPNRLEEGISRFQAPQQPTTIDFEKIEHAFSRPTLPEIIDAWGKEDFQGKSPRSVEIAYTQMQKGLHFSFEEAIEYELILAEERLQSKDLYEGIRYRMIEKIPNPHWIQ